MDLRCYVQPDWAPRIRPAGPRRGWMDATPDSFAYRCLPLAIANAHGWEILSPCGFAARWDGGPAVDAVQIRLDPGTNDVFVPVSLFGAGVLTFHVEGLFRTDPGWNLWVSGPPNHPKDAIQPLSGVIETDWSPYTFTMNWQFTRPGQWVRFEENEPFCFFFPVERKAVEAVDPKLLPMTDDPALKAQFETWRASRMAFHEQMEKDRPAQASESWQKSYYRGVNPDGAPGPEDHQSKLRVASFRLADGSTLQTEATKASPAAAPGEAEAAEGGVGAWLLEALEQQRMSSAQARSIHLRQGLTGQQFLDEYYAPARPVLLAGELAGWPALRLWQPASLADRLGATPVEATDRGTVVGEDPPAPRVLPFDRLIGGTEPGAASSRSAANRTAFSDLWRDLGPLDKFLERDPAGEESWLSITSAGTATPLHLSLRNAIHAQVMGHRRLFLCPPSETPKLYRQVGPFSEIADISDQALDLRRFPRAASVRKLEFVLKPGDLLYVPVGWWVQAQALDVEASVRFMRFKWPNDSHQAFPKG